MEVCVVKSDVELDQFTKTVIHSEVKEHIKTKVFIDRQYDFFISMLFVPDDFSKSVINKATYFIV
jgi:hypothetical protein